MRSFNQAVARVEPKHSLDFGNPLMEDAQTFENTQEGRVGVPRVPKIQGKVKPRELRLSGPLASFTFVLAFFHIFEGPTIFRQSVTKIQAMLGLSPCYGLVKRPQGRLSNRC